MIDIVGYYKINVSAEKIILQKKNKGNYQELCILTRISKMIIGILKRFPVHFGSFGSFQFLWQRLSSLEIFDINAKAPWSNFKVDRNPEFRSLKELSLEFPFSGAEMLWGNTKELTLWQMQNNCWRQIQNKCCFLVHTRLHYIEDLFVFSLCGWIYKAILNKIWQ